LLGEFLHRYNRSSSGMLEPAIALVLYYLLSKIAIRKNT